MAVAPRRRGSSARAPSSMPACSSAVLAVMLGTWLMRQDADAGRAARPRAALRQPVRWRHPQRLHAEDRQQGARGRASSTLVLDSRAPLRLTVQEAQRDRAEPLAGQHPRRRHHPVARPGHRCRRASACRESTAGHLPPARRARPHRRRAPKASSSARTGRRPPMSDSSHARPGLRPEPQPLDPLGLRRRHRGGHRGEPGAGLRRALHLHRRDGRPRPTTAAAPTTRCWPRPRGRTRWAGAPRSRWQDGVLTRDRDRPRGPARRRAGSRACCCARWKARRCRSTSPPPAPGRFMAFAALPAAGPVGGAADADRRARRAARHPRAGGRAVTATAGLPAGLGAGRGRLLRAPPARIAARALAPGQARFCCTGCEGAHALVRGLGLDAFYRRQETAAGTLRPPRGRRPPISRRMRATTAKGVQRARPDGRGPDLRRLRLAGGAGARRRARRALGARAASPRAG